MDSIERMRRINDLTRELKQHGFAESSFEAIKQANQIYGPDQIEDHVKHGMIKNNSPGQSEDEKMDENSSIISDRKIAKITESVDILTEKMNEIIRAINDLDARITEVKQTQSKLAVIVSESKAEQQRYEAKMELGDVEKSTSKIEVKSEDKPVSNSSSQNSQAKDEYSVNQRTGNFQSQDVSIDKMFYYGNKK
jgi:hypothetical protein